MSESPLLKLATRRPGRLCALILSLALGGCASMGGEFSHPGPPHPGAVNPYSSGGFSDPGPNYPDTGH